MIKKSFLLLLLIGTMSITKNTFAQDAEFKAANFKLYDINADPFKQLEEAAKKAKTNGKHIFVQVGGNWCVWCYRFNKFTTTDKQLDSIIKKDYEVIHINYSKENKNLEFLEKMDYPQRFGFPVFLILDENGKRIHTQNSALLEENKGYSKEKTVTFLKQWNTAALDPNNYKK